MKYIILFAGILLYLTTNAQQWSWAKNVLNSYSPYPQNVAVNGVGKVFTSTVYESNSSYSYNIKTAAYSASGQLLWNKNIGTPYNSYAYSKELVADNTNLYLLGFFVHSISFANTTISSSSWQLFIACYDQNGTEKWIKALPLFSDQGNAVTIDNNNDLILTNFSSSPSNGLTVKKISSSGNDIWTKTFSTDALPFSITNDSQNHIYISGSNGAGPLSFDGTVYFNDTTHNENGFIAKLTDIGDIEQVEGIPGGRIRHIKTDANDNLFISGTYYENGMTVRQTTVPAISPCSNPGYCSSSFFAKLQGDSCAWIKTTRRSDNNNFAVSPNGNSYVCGWALSDTSASSMAKITQFNTSGVVQWHKESEGTYMASANSVDIAASGNQDIYLTGAYQSNQYYLNTKVWFGPDTLPYTGYTTNSFLAKLNDAQIVTGHGFESESGLNPLSVYPNPASKMCHITYSSGGVENLHLQMHDVLGNVIYNESVKAHSGDFHYTLDMSNFAKGIYLIGIYSANNKSVQKVVVE
ncbi:MAG: hypothetical protein K0R26_2927 [Bacteroidota bacterium]|jgi:hypothetical protein|nr:hypothetical protein [Bacteroidota bacterium]